MEPLVNAGGVERVSAQRQHMHGPAVLELGEEDGALRRRVLLLRLSFLGGSTGVGHRGYGAEHGLPDAPVCGGGARTADAETAGAGATHDEADAEEQGEDGVMMS